MKKTALLCLVTLIQLFIQQPPANSQPTSFSQLDNFDSYLNGSINGQGNGNWIGNNPGATDGALVTDIPPTSFSGKTFLFNPDGVEYRGNAYRKLGNTSLNTNATATYYFQISLADLSQANLSVGLSDASSPNIFSASADSPFQAEINFQSDGIRVRNGSSLEKVQNFSLQANQLIHVWFLVDHAGNDYQIQLASDGDAITATTSQTTVFQLKDEQNAGSLVSFVIEGQGTTSGDAYIDQLYVDSGNENTTFPAGQFKKVDDFEARQNGALNGQGDWTASSNGLTLINDPNDSSNRVLKAEINNSYGYVPLSSIDNNGNGTLFFRMYRSSAINAFAGLSDVDGPTSWDHFEVQYGAQASPADAFVARNGSQFSSLGSNQFYEDGWYCVWLLVDHAADHSEMYVQGGLFTEPTQLQASGDSTMSFRNGSSDPLDRFYVRVGPDGTGDFLIDDIYIDPDSQNLTRPQGDCPTSTPDTGLGNPLSDPIPETISADGTTIKAETIATVPSSNSGSISSSNPRTRINYLYHAKDGTDRLFVNDLRGKIYVINENNSISTYLDVASQFPNFKTDGSLNAGLSTFAFHPDFESNGLLYTIHYETPNSTIDFDHPNTSQQDKRTHSVIVEWDTNNSSSNSFSGSKREVMRIVQNTALHGVQLIEFNRAATSGSADYGTLYISIGDSEQEPFFSDVSQMLDYPQGKILRIIPDLNDQRGTLSTNQKYRIPADNPFSNATDGSLKEIFAYGFRNPIRFDWDPVSGMMLVSVVGQNNIEEIELVEPGKNYGWN
ncbi:MAG: PQQ-dependent sugar dehydrogenase, partial [Chloroflexota bacterium]